MAEISAASKEQADGVEQINKAVVEMDQVVQQNAANAEESAAASEQMNMQAEHMKGYVDDLVVLVSGAKKQSKDSAAAKYAPHGTSSPGAHAEPPSQIMASLDREVRPHELIPMADMEKF